MAYRLGKRMEGAGRGSRPAMIRSAWRVTLAALLSLYFSGLAAGKDAGDSDDEPAKPPSTLPNIYLDLRTNYATVPAGALSTGLGNSALFSTLQTIQTLANQQALTGLPTLPTLSSPSSQSAGIDVPLTVDLNDRFSIYGGFSASATRTELSDWSTLTISSWMAGFQADIYQQNGGSIPTITLQSTMTQSIPDAPLATTSLNTILEFDYALNPDETRGLLIGIQHTRIAVDTPLATINPATVGYVGGYYQWDNNWKFSGRVGVQSFGGAQLLTRTPFQPFTQPIVRLDLDRMDDNDNRLFGVTAQIAWVPKPSYQLTLRTPLYAVRN